jgi:protocatechuate 3,4-dioxygenase beta subunit
MSLLIAFGLATLLQSAAPTTATVTGRVVEAGTAAPIAGAQVTVMLIPGDRHPPMVFGGLRPYTATTDRDGQYQIAGLQPGHYQVRAQKTGFAMPIDSFAQRIDIAAGPLRGIDLTLQRAAVIVGRVLDESGEPLADARVFAMTRTARVQGAPPADMLRPMGQNTQTNDLGEFRLFNLPPGEYFVQAAPRFDDGQAVGQGRTLLATFYPDTTRAAAAAPLVLAAGQTSDPIDIRMASAPAFHVSGIVVDQEGRPVANVMVRLLSEEPGEKPVAMVMAPWQQGRTDQSGRFTITNVTRGSYTLLAIAPRLVAGPDRRTVVGGVGSASMTWGSAVSGTVSGTAPGTQSGAVMTETRDGTTVEYRDDAGTTVRLTIDDASISNLKVTVRSPAPPPQ